MNRWNLHINRDVVEAGECSLMIWSVCNWHDMRPLIRLDTTNTCDRYESILQPDHLHPSLFILHSKKFVEFQQDNTIPHNSIIATEWL
ncbi:uncharacterized protein TNCT_631051 [Trichonephila clavata]|uniref:Uncharacterized protein n=1 Tax=Trichonephila clavata TaxID=2740835 RepID=A0A8X6J7V1_TRICU|nr:uncharacterized protein TNCT_631051 [Trichonephila clavata]